MFCLFLLNYRTLSEICVIVVIVIVRNEPQRRSGWKCICVSLCLFWLVKIKI